MPKKETIIQPLTKRQLKNFWEKIANPTGHGRVNLNGTINMAHRVSYFLAYGEIPSGMIIRHKTRRRGALRFLDKNRDEINRKKRERRIKVGKCLGEAHQNTTLNNEQILAIREIGRSEKFKDLAIKFKVCPMTISNIIRGVTWKHLLPKTG